MPEKRALVCGVADYDHLQQTNIPGALTAARAWAVRLESFGYQSKNILLLEDAQATKAAVLAKLQKMFEDSGQDDDVMFIIACHGTSIRRDDALGEEQGLVLYPEKGDELLDATLFGAEIAEVAKAAKHGEKTHFNVVIDACFSGGVNPPPLAAQDAGIAAVLRRAVPLRIIPPGGNVGAATTFLDSLREPRALPSKPSTVVIAAADATELAYEGQANDKQRWTFFSYAALKALDSDPNHSYFSLVDKGVTPYLPHQKPVCKGSRKNYHFARRTIREDIRRRDAAAAAPAASRTATNQVTLDVLILGISCFADARPGDAFKKRVLFPTDDLWYPSHSPHLAFLEVEEGDLLNDPGTIVGLSERYTRFGRIYRRFELTSHKITIDKIETQPLVETSAYHDHVPQMTMVQPALSKFPKAGCYLAKPPADLVAGYFDITYGVLGVRRVASYLSYFSPEPPNTWPRGYYAISPQLTLKINDVAPTIRVENLDNGFVSVVRLKPTATEISIGNLTAPTLAGDTKADDPPHDFKLFYNLAETPVDPMPVPSKPIGIETACIPVNWP
jgi:hypothetical protein